MHKNTLSAFPYTFSITKQVLINLYVLIYCIYNPDRTDTQGAGFLLWTKRKRICRKELINRGAAKPLFSALQDLIDPGDDIGDLGQNVVFKLLAEGYGNILGAHPHNGCFQMIKELLTDAGGYLAAEAAG